MSDFIQNAWYMAAWVCEVPDGGFLARRLLDRPWLLFRNPDDSWAMIEDRCPHRFVPLSRGKFADGRVTCGYHGLAFDGSGQCVNNRFGEVPKGASVAKCRVVERHGGLWFWAGDPGLADADAIPDFAFIDAGPPIERAQYVMGVNYQLIADNLLDLSHAEFLHVESFGTNGSLFSHGRQSVVQDASGAIWNKWDMTSASPPGWAAPMLDDGDRIDQALHIRWHAPASLALFIEIRRAGTAEPLVPPMANPHILTPETPGSTHYFFTHEPGPEAEAMARRVFLDEDEPMITAQAGAMDEADFWDMHPLILASDKAAILARRRLMQMHKAEMR
ncbi:aromatic ring-hydroxylating dioxygenase subunit alpha [Novosphingobium sp. MMS21-SN21R]|uniref:aromatic ring-hydroxylating dioxygenase subunit alpha n=1 Tax=Novosphingobium sp. MMS21-SN21R TaxID=2969298 RepID=UPI0028858AFD|nr:aromatic ring-hydroxylating dioxygenase subunit alpha [Novosphingobium sp. MMS21-SN21R]MDT0509988.1 aromatic ring-hydroxylating dioxygenase subunit alpha [Novosphingobium sp. MMS21-SN21R]